jgi:SpoVK/Ycf46/Vps4 family AAA+-type ATPase
MVQSMPQIARSVKCIITKPPACFEGEESEWPKDLGRSESVAVTLQRMRAHVKRVSLEPKGDIYCSVAFHGPAGTGKTTLVEALAKSCEVSLVEVTPSDIIVRGEEAIERRARAVFEALTLLTRVVVLFDEFDPVLWRRDPSDSTPRSVFTFLTPGMLPKLKDLRRCAKKRSCAIALSTNLIGGLDPAAIREGRFDKKSGHISPGPSVQGWAPLESGGCLSRQRGC